MTPPPAGTDLTTGLLVYLKLDDGVGRLTARDASGNGNDGSLVLLDPQRAWVQGHFGTGIDIAGNGWVSVAQSPTINSIAGGFSFSAWIRRTGDGTILARRSVGANGFLYRFFVAGGKLGIQINSSNGARVDLLSAQTVPADRFVHVAVTYDLIRARLFLDGNDAGSQSYNLSIGPEDSPINVGASQDATLVGADDRFVGRLDEVSIFNRPLSEQDVRALRNGFVPPIP